MSDISNEINALPQQLRDYIHHLETDTDPSGTIRENFRLREENAMLRTECAGLTARKEGWRLVPIHATVEMAAKGQIHNLQMADLATIYHRMVMAAPSEND